MSDLFVRDEVYDWLRDIQLKAGHALTQLTSNHPKYAVFEELHRISASAQLASTAVTNLDDDRSRDFDEFYRTYPRKAKRPDAEKAYKAARKKAKHADIMAGVSRLVAERRDPQYLPYPASWLRGESWKDAPTPKALTSGDIFDNLAEFYGAQAEREGGNSEATRIAVQDVPKLENHRS